MMRRYFPLWFPVLVVAIVSAVNYQFWHVETTGESFTTLPEKILSGHRVTLSRPTVSDVHGTWRVHISPQAFGELGGLQIARSHSDKPPTEGDWVRVPSGGINNAFTVIFEADDTGAGSNSGNWIWLRTAAKTDDGIISWRLPAYLR